MGAIIKYIDYYLPECEVNNKDILKMHPDWPMEKLAEKTGIRSRRHAAEDEFSVDMGICAAKRLINANNININEIDFIIFCTQTPKFLVPTNACLIQEALGMGVNVGALDVNQGCSGYVYSLMLAESLVGQRRAKNVLLITSDTYSKLIAKNDRCLLPIFGDGASASLITYETSARGIQLFEYGTSGAGAEKLISQNSGLKGLNSGDGYRPDLYMNGPAIFNFTLEYIPQLVSKVLNNAKISIDQIEHFIFHQANAYMLEHLRQKIGIETKQFIIDMDNTGNTVSSSIPIVICKAMSSGRIKQGDKVVLVGFGVGLSWAACLLQF